MRLLFFISFLTFICLIGCNKEKNNSDIGFGKIDIVTGIVCCDESGQLFNIYGNPNENRIIDNTPSESSYLPITSTFPNPAQDVFNIHSPVKIKTVWILTAEESSSFQNIGFSMELENIAYSKSTLNDKALISFEQESSYLAVNVSDLTQGFYRVFTELENGSVTWHNLFVTRDIEDLDAYFKDIWE